MYFISLKYERTVQVGDKTRLDASKSYGTPDELPISTLEIRPETSGIFYDVSSNKFLDYTSETDGIKAVTVKINGTIEKEYAIVVLTEVEDHLFSEDADLIPHEQDICNFLRDGRNTFKDIHRQAQRIILADLDEKRIWDNNGNRLSKHAIVDIEEVREWSKYLTLRLLFESQSNATDDIFSTKAQKYKEMELKASNRAALRLDLNGDGEEDAPIDLVSTTLLRR